MVTVAENIDCDNPSSLFKNGYAVLVKSIDNTEYYAYINTNGEIMGDGYVYLSAGNFDSNGIANVTFKDGTKGYINTSFEAVDSIRKNQIEIKAVYDSLQNKGIKYTSVNFENVYKNIYIANANIDGYFLDCIAKASGEILIDFDKQNEYNYDFIEHYRFIQNTKINGAMNIIDLRGNVLYSFPQNDVSAKQSRIETTESLGAIRYLYTDKTENAVMGFVDKNGQNDTKAIYTYDPTFIDFNNFAYVSYAQKEGGAFIDSKGQEVLKIDGISDARVYKHAIICRINEQDFVYTLDGKRISSVGFDRIYSVYDNYCIADANTIIDIYGNILYRADEIYNYYEYEIHDTGYFFVIKDEKVSLVKIA